MAPAARRALVAKERRTREREAPAADDRTTSQVLTSVAGKVRAVPAVRGFLRIVAALMVSVSWLLTPPSVTYPGGVVYGPAGGFQILTIGSFILPLLVLLIASIIVNLVVYGGPSRRNQRLPASSRELFAEILAVLGGVATLVAAVLPWETSASRTSTASCPCVFVYRDGLNLYGINSGIVWVGGLLWLVFFAVPKKASAAWGLGWGSFALVLSLIAFALITDDAAMSARATPGWQIIANPGIYGSLLGSLVVLFSNAFLLYVATRDAGGSGPVLLEGVAPPGPEVP